MVIDRYCELFLGLILADYVAVEKGFDLRRAGKTTIRRAGLLALFVFKNLLANADALVAMYERGYSEGELMSFSTCSCVLWQKEQRSGSSGVKRFTGIASSQGTSPHPRQFLNTF